MGPYHILIATGEQGSAKSSLFRFCRSVIDPVKLAPLASLPREERDLGIDGQSEYMLCYDNVSFLAALALRCVLPCGHRWWNQDPQTLHR